MKTITVIVLICALSPTILAAQWRPVDGADRYTGVSMCLNDSVVFAATKDGVFRYTRNENHVVDWEPFRVGLPPALTLYKIDTVMGTPYLCTDNGLFDALPGFGVDWRENRLRKALTGRAYMLFSRRNLVFVGSERGIWVSTDTGRYWSHYDFGPSGNEVTAIDWGNGVLYACVRSNQDTSRIWRSTDTAATWSLVTTSGLGTPPVYAFHISGDSVMIGTSIGLYRLEAQTWQEIMNGDGGRGQVRDFAEDDGIIVAGTNDGVMTSTDSGATWVSDNDGLPPNTQVNTVRIRNGEAYICTDNHWIWTQTLGDLLGPHVTILDGGPLRCRGEFVDLGLRITGRIRIDSIKVTAGEHIDSVTVRARAGDTIIVRAVDARRRAGSDTMIVPFVPPPNAGTDTTVCAGSAVTLGSPRNGPGTYEWTSSDGLFASAATNPVVRPTKTTEYYLKFNDSLAGCEGTDTVRVAVLSDRDTTIRLCADSPVAIGESVVSGTTYIWDSVYTGDSASIRLTYTTARITVSPDVAAVYRRTAKLPGGCSVVDTFRIVPHRIPVGLAGNDTSICLGTVVTIGSNATGMTYRWHLARGLVPSDTNLATPAVRPDVTTTYYVDLHDSTGCTAVDSVKVTVRGAVRQFVMRIARDTLVAWPGRALAWYRDGIEITRGVDTLTGLDDGVYRFTAIGSDGDTVTSRPREVSISEPLFMPDLHVPFCALGYEKRRMVMITNDGATAILIDSVRIASDDPNGCDTISRFTLRNPLNGIMLGRGDSVPAFIGYVPVDIDTNSAAIIVDFTEQTVPKTQHRTVASVSGISADDGDVVKADVSLADVKSVGPGDTTHLEYDVRTRDDLSGVLRRTIAKERCAVRYRIVLWLTSCALLHIGKPAPKICNTTSPNLKGYPEYGPLWITYEAAYDDTLNHNTYFNCKAMLGDVEQMDVLIGTFQWLDSETFKKTAEKYDDAVTFRLDGICRDNGQRPRLVEAAPMPKPVVKITVSPNPIDRVLTFTYELSTPGLASFALYDVFGRIVQRGDLGPAAAGVNGAQCDVGMLPVGSYFVMLTSSGGYAVARFEIER